MAHRCIDWTANPPTRKIPLLVLTRGDDHVYAAVPKEFKTLEALARTQFGLGDADIVFSSSCVSLCNGLPARITESAWEHLSPYIGCATVEVSDPSRPPQGVLPNVQPPRSENAGDEPSVGAKRKLPLDADQGREHKRPDHALGSKPSTSAKEVLRDEQAPPSDRDDASTPRDQHEDEQAIPRKSQHERRVVSEDGGQGEGSERVRSQVSPVASQPKQDKEIKKLQQAEALHQPDRPIKQERGERGRQSRPHSEDGHSVHEAGPQAPAESGENHKLVICVAHRPSQQESMFTTKNTTKVAKVLAGACKSFGLDVSHATLYLIVSVEDEDGDVENLFPCDRNDTIARAGAERDTESRFLLKMAGEA